MSRRASGLTIAEKITGLALLAIGAILAYFSIQTIHDMPNHWAIFATAGIIIAIIGLILTTAKTE